MSPEAAFARALVTRFGGESGMSSVFFRLAGCEVGLEETIMIYLNKSQVCLMRNGSVGLHLSPENGVWPEGK